MKPKSKFNRGVILLVVILLVVVSVALYDNSKITQEREAAQKVVYEALDGYVKYRIIPQEIRDLYYDALEEAKKENSNLTKEDILAGLLSPEIKPDNIVNIVDLDIILDNYLKGYESLLCELIYDSDSPYQSQKISNMVEDARESLKKHFSEYPEKKEENADTDIENTTYLVSNVVDNYELYDCTDDLRALPTDSVFEINKKHTEITMTVKYDVLYGENTYETTNTFRLIKTADNGWQIFDTYLIITSIR